MYFVAIYKLQKRKIYKPELPLNINMALTGKLTDIVRNTAYALTAGLALASTAYSEQPKPFGDAIPQYSQEQLKPPVWPKEMSETERKDTGKYYQILNPEEKIAFKEIFTKPKGAFVMEFVSDYVLAQGNSVKGSSQAKFSIPLKGKGKFLIALKKTNYREL